MTRTPRHNDAAVDAVAGSIKEFGFQQPIVVDKDHVIIVGTHPRESGRTAWTDRSPGGDR